MIFDYTDWQKLSTLFQPDARYPGYKPEVKEIPNGDGKVDAEKRYLHVALKYDPPEWAIGYLARAHFEACRVAEALGVPAEFYPRVADGTLRVLDYPAGAGSNAHTDFDLFTVLCYRSESDALVRVRAGGLDALDTISPGLHIGEIGELVGIGPATPHMVLPSAARQQSIVYFAIPDLAALLPTHGAQRTGLTVGQWLKERYARSRT